MDVFGLTPEQAARARLLIASRVHQFSLVQLALHGVSIVRAPLEPGGSRAAAAADAVLAAWPVRRTAAASLGVDPCHPPVPAAALLYSAAGGGDLMEALAHGPLAPARGDGDGRPLRGRGSRGGRRGGRGGWADAGGKRGHDDSDDDGGGGGGGGGGAVSKRGRGAGRGRSGRGAAGGADAADGGADDDEAGDDDGNLSYCNECEYRGDLLCCDRYDTYSGRSRCSGGRRVPTPRTSRQCEGALGSLLWPRRPTSPSTRSAPRQSPVSAPYTPHAARCPRAFHAECLRLGDVPEGEWLCPDCVREFGRPGSGTSRPAGPGYFDGPFSGRGARCGGAPEAELRDIVAGLRASDFAAPFLEPVDAGFRAYHAAIPRPRDLGTIASALAAGREYGRGAAFDAPRALTDLRLVWANCKRFNRPMSTIWRLADVLSRETEAALRERVRLTDAQAAELRALRERELAAPNLHVVTAAKGARA